VAVHAVCVVPISCIQPVGPTFYNSQEMYLSPRVLAAAGAPPCEGADAHAHFTLRPRREPKKSLGAVVSSSAAAAAKLALQSSGSIPCLMDGGGAGSFTARWGQVDTPRHIIKRSLNPRFLS